MFILYLCLLPSCPTYYLIVQFSEISSTRGKSCHNVNNINIIYNIPIIYHVQFRRSQMYLVVLERQTEDRRLENEAN